MTLADHKIRCIDGDTFVLDEEKIRLLVVDTPEIGTHEQPYGEQAAARTCALLKQATCIQLREESGNTEDEYGRKLYWVYLDDTLLQQTLVSEGLATLRYQNEHNDQDIVAQLKQAAQQAQTNGLGIYAKE